MTEVGELVDELMRLPGYPDVTPARSNPRVSSLDDVATEAADVLLMLLSSISHLDIDLEDAFYERVQQLSVKHSGRPLIIDERR